MQLKIWHVSAAAAAASVTSATTTLPPFECETTIGDLGERIYGAPTFNNNCNSIDDLFCVSSSSAACDGCAVSGFFVKTGKLAFEPIRMSSSGYGVQLDPSGNYLVVMHNDATELYALKCLWTLRRTALLLRDSALCHGAINTAFQIFNVMVRTAMYLG